jgi:hypothetical protein
MKEYISFLQNAIQKLHGVASEHIKTVSVTERFQGQTVWEGEVEVFKVPEHPKAENLFAWAYKESDDEPELKTVTVLSLPPITTPQKAVQAFIASQYRKEQSNERE